MTSHEVHRDLTKMFEPFLESSSRTPPVIRLPNGGRLDFWSLENSIVGRGRGYQRVVIDEAAFTKNGDNRSEDSMMAHWEKGIKPIHPADKGDATTLDPTLEAAARNLADIGLAPAPDDPCDLVADKGYHSRNGLKGLDGGGWKTRIAELKPANGYLRWHGDEAAREAVYANRARLNSGVGRQAMRRRGENGREEFCSCPRSRRHAPRLAARSPERSQALSQPLPTGAT
jgi:hypothetical protein